MRASRNRKGPHRAQASDDCLLLEMEGLLNRAEGRLGIAIERLDAARIAATSWETRLRIDREAIETLLVAGRHDEARVAIQRAQRVLDGADLDDPMTMAAR